MEPRLLAASLWSFNLVTWMLHFSTRTVLCPADAKLVHQAATSHFTSRSVRGPSFPCSHTPPILPKLSTPKRWMLCAYASCQALPMLRICRSEFDKLRFAADIDPRVLTQCSRLLASCHSARHIAVEFAFLSFSTTGILDLSWADTSSFKPQAYGREDPSQLRLSLRASGGLMRTGSEESAEGRGCSKPHTVCQTRPGTLHQMNWMQNRLLSLQGKLGET